MFEGPPPKAHAIFWPPQLQPASFGALGEAAYTHPYHGEK